MGLRGNGRGSDVGGSDVLSDPHLDPHPLSPPAVPGSYYMYGTRVVS